MLILKNGTLVTMAGATMLGDLSMDKGKILQVGGYIEAGANDRVIDCTGQYITPGLVDAHTHIGLMETGTRDSDHNEKTNPTTPQMRAIDAINPFDSAFEDALKGGVTSGVTCPGSINLIGGTCAAIKMKGTLVDNMLIKDDICMKAALGENPKFRYTEQKKSPMSRMASAALMRAAFAKAQDYQRKVELAKDHPEKMPDRDLGMEALAKVLSGELHLKIHIHRSDDIATAIRVANEFGVKYTLDHCTEGFRIFDLIKSEIEKGNCRGVIAGPLFGYKRKGELMNSQRLLYPRMLYEAGIPFAICTDFYETPQDFLRNAAIMAAAEGLPDDVALAAITCNAAKIVGIEDRVGSLKAGLDADVAVFSGEPMDIRSHCIMTIINGEIVYERRA